MKPDTSGLNKYINQAISAAYDAGFDDGKKAAEKDEETVCPYDFKPGDVLRNKIDSDKYFAIGKPYMSKCDGEWAIEVLWFADDEFYSLLPSCERLEKTGKHIKIESTEA